MSEPISSVLSFAQPPASFSGLVGLVVELNALTAIAHPLSHRERVERGLLASGSDLYHKILEAAVALSSDDATHSQQCVAVLAPERNTHGNPPIKDLCESITSSPWIDGKSDPKSYCQILSICKGLQQAVALGTSAKAV